MKVKVSESGRKALAMQWLSRNYGMDSMTIEDIDDVPNYYDVDGILVFHYRPDLRTIYVGDSSVSDGLANIFGYTKHIEFKRIIKEWFNEEFNQDALDLVFL